MQRLERIKRIGYFHAFIIKAILETGGSATVKEVGQKLGPILKSAEYKQDVLRVMFTQKARDLIEIGILEKSRSSIAVYSIKKKAIPLARLFSSAYDALLEGID